MNTINWPQMITGLISRGISQADIARSVGLSPSSIVDLISGRQKSVRWEVGEKLRDLHARTLQRKE